MTKFRSWIIDNVGLTTLIAFAVGCGTIMTKQVQQESILVEQRQDIKQIQVELTNLRIDFNAKFGIPSSPISSTDTVKMKRYSPGSVIAAPKN